MLSQYKRTTAPLTYADGRYVLPTVTKSHIGSKNGIAVMQLSV